MPTKKKVKKPLIAIPSFPGSNGEVDNVRTLKRCGFDCLIFRWNDSLEKLQDVDGYFFGAGFSYEDRGRSGMVAARDPLFAFMREESRKGKVIVGNCNGAQVLIESGLLPLPGSLSMCLARNAVQTTDGQWKSPGFLNQWVWITPSCSPDRCATSNWSGALHIPIAHGEGRFVTKDLDLISELESRGQIAFRYCTQDGVVSADVPVTPNGSTGGIAGVCNPEGNVVALMPHPERTPLGDPYFHSIKQWIESHPVHPAGELQTQVNQLSALDEQSALPYEIFIGTLITNNEERTVEHALKRTLPTIHLKQWRYVGMQKDCVKELLSKLSFFNPHKEVAYVRTSGAVHLWNSDSKKVDRATVSIFRGITLLRRDEPDTLGSVIGDGAISGVCYDCRSVERDQLLQTAPCEVLCNPHASTLSFLRS